MHWPLVARGSKPCGASGALAMSVMNVAVSAVTGKLNKSAISVEIEGARVAKNVPVVSRS